MRPKGHIRDVADARDWPISRLVGAGDVPDSVDLTRYIDHVRDQGPSNACVGFALARAIHIRAQAMGAPIAFPSTLAIYAFARSVPLFDFGCQPRLAIDGMSTYGVVTEERWPFDAAKVNALPPWDVCQRGADALVTGYYAIGGDGAERCAAARQSLAQAIPVPFAMNVDQPYEDGPSAVYAGLTGPSLGSHYQCLVGYRPGAFLVCNSWSSRWADGGLAWLSDAFVGSADCFDFWAMSVAPKATT